MSVWVINALSALKTVEDAANMWVSASSVMIIISFTRMYAMKSN
mgnify:CR=1 FL=1